MSHRFKPFDYFCPKCQRRAEACNVNPCFDRAGGRKCTCSNSGGESGECASECVSKSRHHKIGHKLKSQMQNIIKGSSQATADGLQHKAEEHDQGWWQLGESHKAEAEARWKTKDIEKQRIRKEHDGAEIVKDPETLN
jgi:hypothetical protein